MKKVIHIHILLLSIIIISHQTLSSQTTKLENGHTFKLWVSKMDKSKKAKGYLYEIEDSLITVMDFSGQGVYQKVDVQNIKEIKLRKRGKPMKGIFFGALVGFSMGAIIGYAAGDDQGSFSLFSAGEKAIIGGTLLVIPGAIIGGVIGHQMSVKIPIRGSQIMYDEQLVKLRRYQLAF